MSNLGDEAEAFFRRGDDGTYEGGPASIPPLVLCEEPEENWDVHSADEWLERRRVLKRFVVTVVGVLGVGLLILSVCLVGASARSVEDAGRRPQSPSLPRVTKAFVPPPVTAVAAAPDRPLPTPVATGASEQPAPSAPLTSGLAGPQPRQATEGMGSTPVRRVASMRSHAPASASPRRSSFDRGRVNAAGRLPLGSVDLPAVPGSFTVLRGTPTALFSN